MTPKLDFELRGFRVPVMTKHSWEELTSKDNKPMHSGAIQKAFETHIEVILVSRKRGIVPQWATQTT